MLKCYKLLIIKNSPLYVVLGSRQKVGVIFSASFYSRKLFYLGMISPSIESHSRALRHLLNFYYNHALLFHHTFLSFLKQISISYSPSTQTLVHIIRNLNQDMKNNILIPEMLYTSLSWIFNPNTLSFSHISSLLMVIKIFVSHVSSVSIIVAYHMSLAS